MRIDYSKRWPHQHLIAIESAYRSSPYYDYYADRFTPLFEREWERLVDLNMATFEVVCKTLKIKTPRISDTYITATEGDLDLRDKKRGSTLCAEPYIQVFDDRLPFAPNLSIFDLLMCEGPEALNYLKRAKL
jgi:hypothetical protein